MVTDMSGMILLLSMILFLWHILLDTHTNIILLLMVIEHFKYR
jgi:hypothetical protein